MYNIIQKIKDIAKKSFLKTDKKIDTPLLSNSDILELLHRVQANKKSIASKHHSAFRQIGEMRSIFHGQGMDYEESRPYQPGDDPRYMNWQLTARTGQQFLKVFREERQPGIFIVVDRRNSMRFGTKKRLKITQAARIAAIQAFSAQQNNFSVGGVILENSLQWFKENDNKQAIFDFIHHAARPAFPAFDNIDIEESKLSDVLKILNEILTLGSTVYIISDFHDIAEENQAALLQLSASHQINAIQISDPAEIHLPDAGTLKLREINSNKHININSSEKDTNNSYKNKATEYFLLKQNIFKNISMPYQQILTTEDAVDKILAR